MVMSDGPKAIFLAIFVASIALTSCSQIPANNYAVQQSVVEPANTSANSLIQGTYTNKITGAELSPSLSTSEEYLGEWQLKLGDEGTYSTLLNGETMSQGRYYFVNNEMVFSESRYSRLCPASETDLAGTEGIYDYSFTGDGLTFQAVSDDCTGRSFLMQVHYMAAT